MAEFTRDDEGHITHIELLGAGGYGEVHKVSGSKREANVCRCGTGGLGRKAHEAAPKLTVLGLRKKSYSSICW
jgi:hypothetical protein